jgi:hypothetical protein
MNIHHLHPETGEYLGTSPARLNPRETQRAGYPVYLIPAHATTCALPEAIEGMARVWNGSEWTQAEDHRGVAMYRKADGRQSSMVALGPIPDGYTLETPPAGMIRPKFDGETWIEQAVVFQGSEVASKVDVDRITRKRIIDLGEEKAKTEKLLAGSNPCPIWDEFVAQRAVLLQEGDDFIAAHELT